MSPSRRGLPEVRHAVVVPGEGDRPRSATLNAPMTERIYARDLQGRLEPLEEERFAKEDELQALIAEHPEVLDGEQMRPGDPLRWILITREQGIAESSPDAAARWAVDHLIVDQDAVPTLVEVKRGSSAELRRTIVGQMLEYAAHAARTWTADTLRRAFEESTTTRGLDPSEVLGRLLMADGEPDADGFWESVATNLAATRLRLLFVADDIPDPLERVVEFLNAQMAGIEVLAVEIKQFKGNSSQTLVPRVIGRTAASPQRPVAQGTRRSKLDRESFLKAFTNDEHRSVAVRLLGVADQSGAIVERYANGVGIRIPCARWKKPVGVAWLFPPSEWGKAVLRGLTAVSFGISVDLPATVASLPDEERLVDASLRRWVEEIAGYDFAKDADTPYYHARTISYDDAALHIDQLASGLARVVSEMQSL